MKYIYFYILYIYYNIYYPYNIYYIYFIKNEFKFLSKNM
uniref:Uncharacterized protein n=1 Tax=viral metagenome TaxID=1070528 RepID=A0A6C0ITY5_9ZZZZ